MENYKCFTEKCYQQWSIHVSNVQNSFTTQRFVMTTLYKRVTKFITSMLIHCKHDLCWTEVHSEYGDTVLFWYLGGGVRYMDWEVSENQRYDRVLVSGHVSDGVGTWIGMYRRSQSTTVFLYRVRRNMDWARYKNQYRDTSDRVYFSIKWSMWVA